MSQRGFGFIDDYLDASTEMMICQCFRLGILRVGTTECGLKIGKLPKWELRDVQEDILTANFNKNS